MRYNILEAGVVIASAATMELAEMVRDCDPDHYTIEDTESGEVTPNPNACLKCGWDGKMTKVFLHAGRVRVSCPDCGYSETHSPEDGD